MNKSGGLQRNASGSRRIKGGTWMHYCKDLSGQERERERVQLVSLYGFQQRRMLDPVFSARTQETTF